MPKRSIASEFGVIAGWGATEFGMRLFITDIES